MFERLRDKKGKERNGTYSDGVEGQDAAVFEFSRHEFCAVGAPHLSVNTWFLISCKKGEMWLGGQNIRFQRNIRVRRVADK